MGPPYCFPSSSHSPTTPNCGTCATCRRIYCRGTAGTASWTMSGNRCSTSPPCAPCRRSDWPDNDLQDFITTKVAAAKTNNRRYTLRGSIFLAATGGRRQSFHTNGGAHDIHMNREIQRTASSPATMRSTSDVASLLENGLNSFTGIFLAFQTQLIPTDDHGKCRWRTRSRSFSGTGDGNVASQAADHPSLGHA